MNHLPKYILSLLVISVVAITILNSPNRNQANAALDSGLQAYYKFDDNQGAIASDSSGNNINGTLFNNPTWTTGKIGNTISFDGVNDYVSLPKINNKSLSLSLWFFRNNVDVVSQDFIFGGASWPVSNSSKEGFSLRFRGPSSETLVFDLATTNGSVKTARTASYTFSTSTSINLWHHVVITYDSSTGAQKLYVDNRLRNTQNHPVGNTIVPMVFLSDMRIGDAAAHITNGYWNGLIDDVRIYSRAVSSQEVDALYNSVNPPPPTSSSLSSVMPTPSSSASSTSSISSSSSTSSSSSPAPASSSSSSALSFDCTQVIGFSQAFGWYAKGFEQVQGIDNGKWQYLGHSGASIEMWTDPNYVGWTSADNANYVDNPNADGDHIYSNCAVNSMNPDRVIISITATPNPMSAPTTSVAYQNNNEKISIEDLNDWVIDIKTAISVIKSKYTNVRQIVLQPLVGGPNHSLCSSPTTTPSDLLARYPNVRASVNHPIADQAIDMVVSELGSQGVAKGFSPEVRDCSEYTDYMGHLTGIGYAAAATAIGNYYGSVFGN